MEGFSSGKLMRIFVDECDRLGVQPLYAAIVEFLRGRDISGATVFRGIEGFGGHDKIRVAKMFSWLPNLPILIEVIDDEAKLVGLLPELRAMMPDGLITMEAIEYQRVGTPARATR